MRATRRGPTTEAISRCVEGGKGQGGERRRIFESVQAVTKKCIMARKPPKANPEATVCKYVAKYGLAAHMIFNADGTVAAVMISRPGLITQDITEETSEDIRKLL